MSSLSVGQSAGIGPGKTPLTVCAWWCDASPLTVVGHAPDGTIEAVEKDAHPWLVAVQWHPELTADEDARQQRLFDSLVTVASDMSVVNKRS